MIQAVEPTLVSASGPLWVMIALDTVFRDDADRGLAQALTAFVEARQLGVWDGESSGGGAMDLSFTVSNQHTTARAIAGFLSQHAPTCSYAITDRYEPFFELEAPPSIGCVAALLVNPSLQILFQLRDDTPTIAYPNMWALPGGHIEAGETAMQAITRELAEELTYAGVLEPCYEYLFWRTPGVVVHQVLFRGTLAVPAHEIVFHEGQAMRYFTRDDVDRYSIAFGYDRICRAIWDAVCVDTEQR